MTETTGPENYAGGELEILALAQRYSAWILDSFGPGLAGDVLEVGAGAGNLTRLIRERTAVRSVTALEPASNLFPLLERACAQLPQVRCLQSTLGAALETTTSGFDCAIYSNVLEHIEDDEGELRLARSALHAGGWLCVFVPAMPALMSDFDRQIGHFRRYTRAGLGSLARASGFEIHRLYYMDFAGMLSWWLGMRVLRARPSAGMVRIYEHLVPLIRRIEDWKHPPVGKNLLLLARKPVLARS